ncbi:MAG: hypothetical protein ACKO0Z_15095 [Betaproteobacteria bacterium]
MPKLLGAEPKKPVVIAMLMEGRSVDRIVRDAHVSKKYVLSLRKAADLMGQMSDNKRSEQ